MCIRDRECPSLCNLRLWVAPLRTLCGYERTTEAVSYTHLDVYKRHLQYVAKLEHINAEPEALTVIAQKADGGMRDALSIFDQVRCV